MKRLPIDLSLKTVTTKVSVNAWERAQRLKESYGVRLSDVISAALLHIPEGDLARIFKEQSAAVDKLPRAIRAMLQNVDKLSEEERQTLRDILG